MWRQRVNEEERNELELKLKKTVQDVSVSAMSAELIASNLCGWRGSAEPICLRCTSYCLDRSGQALVAFLEFLYLIFIRSYKELSSHAT